MVAANIYPCFFQALQAFSAPLSRIVYTLHDYSMVVIGSPHNFIDHSSRKSARTDSGMRPLVLGTKLDESSHSRLETKEPEVPYKKGTSGERIHSHSANSDIVGCI